MKNVLFVTYYWPPAGGVSTNRIVHFAHYLEKYGWNVSVLTPKSGMHSFTDPSLASLVQNVNVYRTESSSFLKESNKLSSKDSIPYTFTEPAYSKTVKQKLKQFIKFNAIPDTRVYWLFQVDNVIRRIMKENQVDLVFSSSPPQTNHLIANRLSQKYHIPWVADLRDPWSDVFWLKKIQKRTSLAEWIDKKIEKRVLKNPDALVTVTNKWVERYSLYNDKTHCIFNGYNHDIHNKVNLISEYNTSQKFTILYSGSISFQQNVKPFLKAVLSAIQINPNFKDRLEIIWLGNFPSFLRSEVEKNDLISFSRFEPFTTMEEAIKKMRSSNLLLNIGFGSEAGTGTIHSKLFDYIAAKRPVLGIGLEHEASEILKMSRLGNSFTYDQIEDIRDFILQVFSNEFIIGANQSYIESFSREAQTQQLAQIFDDVWSRRHH